MYARRLPFGGGNKRGQAVHIVWILVAAYLCGVLTVPLITTSTRMVRPPVRISSSGGEDVAKLDLELEEKVATQLKETSSVEEGAVAESVSRNPTTRRPQANKVKTGSRSSGSIIKEPVKFDPQLVLQQKPVTDFYRFRGPCPDTVTNVRSYLTDKLFDGTSPYEDFPPDWASPYLQTSNAKGWGSKTKVFERLLKEVEPEVVIELGAFLGASAIHMANLTTRMGLQTTILAVDDFRGWLTLRDMYPELKIAQMNANVMLLFQFMQNVVAEGFQDVILPVPYSTSAALSQFCGWGLKADLIEVDAGHDFHSAWNDINAAFNVLKPGGVMFGHDYFTKADNRGVHRAVDLFARTYGFTVEADGQHWIMRGTP